MTGELRWSMREDGLVGVARPPDFDITGFDITDFGITDFGITDFGIITRIQSSRVS